MEELNENLELDLIEKGYNPRTSFKPTEKETEDIIMNISEGDNSKTIFIDGNIHVKLKNDSISYLSIFNNLFISQIQGFASNPKGICLTNSHNENRVERLEIHKKDLEWKISNDSFFSNSDVEIRQGSSGKRKKKILNIYDNINNRCVKYGIKKFDDDFQKQKLKWENIANRFNLKIEEEEISNISYQTINHNNKKPSNTEMNVKSHFSMNDSKNGITFNVYSGRISQYSEGGGAHYGGDIIEVTFPEQISKIYLENIQGSILQFDGKNCETKEIVTEHDIKINKIIEKDFQSICVTPYSFSNAYETIKLIKSLYEINDKYKIQKKIA